MRVIKRIIAIENGMEHVIQRTRERERKMKEKEIN